jgi:hypothetical protein
VMWLLKKVSRTVKTPPSCLSSTSCLERMCAGLRRAEDDDEVAALLGRCLGLYCRLARTYPPWPLMLGAVAHPSVCVSVYVCVGSRANCRVCAPGGLPTRGR